MKLENIRPLGRYRNVKTGKEYNVKTGRQKGRSIDTLFYVYRGERQIISDAEFYCDYQKVEK
mgnify:CR=1 FL=1